MKSGFNPFLRTFTLASIGVFSFAADSSAATYQWNGSSSSDWATASNWVPTGSWNGGQTITAGPAPTGGTQEHRVNINNQAASEAVYSAAQGSTTYTGGGNRSLVIGSGAPPQGGGGTLRITGGTLATTGSGDVIGNSGNTGILIVDGGNYSASAQVGLGIGGSTATLTINSGSATVPTLNLNNTTGTIQLNGGVLAMNNISRTAGTNAINLNGGTLRARQNNTAFIATGVNAINAVGASTIDTNGFDVSINSPISGSATLTKNNGGKLTLTANNSFNGGLVINSGSLALAPSTVTTFAGNVSGAGALEIGGTGVVNLTGSHTHGGGTTVLSGAGLGGEGSLTGSLTFQGTHSFLFDPATTGSNQHLRAGSISAGTATISVAPVTGAGGSNIVVMEASGGITGTIGTNFIGSSRLALSFDGPSQTKLLAVYTPASLTWTGSNVPNPTFWDTNATTNWDNGGSPDKFLAGDNVLFNDGASSFTVSVQSAVLPGTVTFDHSTNDYTVSGAAIGGGASLIKNGSRFLFLNTPNTYTGTTTINGGTVVLGHNSALGSADGGTTVTVGGTLDLNNRNLGTEVITISGDGDGSGALINSGAEQTDAVGRLVLAANASIGGSNRWDLRNSTPTLNMGGFTLEKKGSNYVALVGVATSNPGNIDVAAGTLSVQTSTTLGGSAINTITVRENAVLSSWRSDNPVHWSLAFEDLATLRSESSSVATQNHWAGPVTLENGGTFTVLADATMTVSGAISGTGSSINKTGVGTAFISGANTYSGTTTVSGGSWVVQNPGALGSTTAGTSVLNGARVELDNLTVSGESITIAGDGANFFGALQGRAGSSNWSGNVIVNANATRIGTQAGATFEVSGVISSTSTHNVIFRPSNNDSPVVVSGSNTYTGPTSIVGGVVIASNLGSVAGGPSNFGAPTSVENGTIRMSVAGGTGTLRYTGSGETTDRVIDLFAPTNGAFIEQAGTGLLKFTSDLTATGAGTKTLVLSGSTAGNGELAGAVVNNSETNVTNLRKDGSGTWTISGTNTYGGTTLINAGTLVVSNASALGSTAAGTAVPGNGLFGTLALTGDITITGEALTLGARQDAIIDVPHVTNPSGNNTWTGNVTFDVGGFDYNFESQSGFLTMAGQISAGGLTGNRNIKLMGAGDGEVSGEITNGTSTAVVRVTKVGAGSWTLSGSNSYTGPTIVTGGTLKLGSTGSIDASTSLTVAAGAELDTTAKSSHTLPSAVTIGLDGDSDTSGLIDAAGQTLDIDGANVTFSVTGTLGAEAYVIANYGALSGDPGFAGVTPPAGYQIDYAHNGGPQIALVKVAGTAYDAWIDTYFPDETDPAIIGGNADPDDDGASNLLEFALKGVPNDGSNNGLYASLVQDASAPTGSELTLVAAVRDGATFAGDGTPVVQTATVDGVVYTMEGSLDLLTMPGSNVSHASGPSNTAPAATGLPDLTGTGWEYHTFKLDASEGLGGNGFLRARIEAAP